MKILLHASVKKKSKRLSGFNWVSDFALLLVVFKWQYGIEGVNRGVPLYQCSQIHMCNKAWPLWCELFSGGWGPARPQRPTAEEETSVWSSTGPELLPRGILPHSWRWRAHEDRHCHLWNGCQTVHGEAWCAGHQDLAGWRAHLDRLGSQVGKGGLKCCQDQAG